MNPHGGSVSRDTDPSLKLRVNSRSSCSLLSSVSRDTDPSLKLYSYVLDVAELGRSVSRDTDPSLKRLYNRRDGFCIFCVRSVEILTLH